MYVLKSINNKIFQIEIKYTTAKGAAGKKCEINGNIVNNFFLEQSHTKLLLFIVPKNWVFYYPHLRYMEVYYGY